MIEVVSYGKRFATCNGCNAVLRFDETDIHTEDLGYNDFGKFIICPICGTRIREKYWNKDLKFRQV